MQQQPLIRRRPDLFWFHFVLLLGGLGSFYYFFVEPLLATRNQDGWVTTACSIESSVLKSPAAGTTNTAYAVEVRYRYAYQGRDHQFSHTHLIGESTGQRKARRTVNRRFGPGRKGVCYVNPRNPSEAVLKRPTGGAPATDWYALSPLALVAVGLTGMFRTGARRSAAPTPTRPGRSRLRPLALSNHAPPSEAVLTPQEPGTPIESLEFKPARARWERVVILGLVALVMNGAMAAFLWMFTKDGLPAGVFAVETLLLLLGATAFGFLGLGLLALCGYFFLALFNPRPWFQVSTRTLAPGDTLEVEWQLVGRTGQIRRLRIFLEGIEVATCMRGTDRLIDRQILDQVPVIEITEVDQIQTGRARLVLPAQLIPSFESPHNQIEWSLRIHGEIPRWPDLQERMPLTLLLASPVAMASSNPG